MSGLARFFLHEKKQVSGSDRAMSPVTEALSLEGVVVFSPQNASNITADIDMVVYTEAMSPDHEEMKAARQLGVPMMNYFEALGLVANEYYLIAVAGTHGKSTTTAMLIDILEEAGFDPTAIVGAVRSKTHSNFRPGKSKYAIVEACEYKRDFLHLKPDVLIITNIDHEHVDYYKDLDDVQRAFTELALQVPETGAVIANTTDINVQPVLTALSCQVIDYRPAISLQTPLKQPGLHNRQNAAAAKAAARFLGIEDTVIDTALEHFAGTKRRFEYKGTFVNDFGKVLVYDDYAHNPQKVEASIMGAKELYPHSPITVVFQSHTYSRTHTLLNDFVSALSKADTVFMLPIYAAREENTYGVSSEQLVEKLTNLGVSSEVFQTEGGVVEAVRERTEAGGVVIVMGAGDVTQVADLLTK